MKEGILLYDLEASSLQHLESQYLLHYRCKVLILSSGLLRCLNQNRSHFLDKVLQPAEKVVILLCGVDNSKPLYDVLTIDQGSQEVTTDQNAEDYLSVVVGVVQQGKAQDEEAKESLTCRYQTLPVLG
uniref:PIK3AP1 Toll/interleukin-1 receptor domain-containing protein n=1 Tax=Sphenodon punctatus TaxID=8508 RepID=A0A8D0H4B4_SPHPU